jgi:Uma2 family endonuclease
LALTTPPVWVCEVLLPENVQRARVEKLEVYADHGVGHVWLIEPVAGVFEILRLQRSGAWTRVGAFACGERFYPEPFVAPTFSAAKWWFDG